VPRSAEAIVVEPHAAHISAHAALEPALKLSRCINDPRLHILMPHDPRVLPTHLVDRLVASRLLSISLVPHAPSMQTPEPFYRTALEVIPKDFPASMQRQC
jgi:hypothetical protein